MSLFGGLGLSNSTDQRVCELVFDGFLQGDGLSRCRQQARKPETDPGASRAIVPLARGVVLEIGVGSGANFPYYDQARVERLYALEPNRGMLRLAEAQPHQTSLDIQFLTLTGERIPLEDQSVDTIVSTFTLCTIPALEQALHGIARVLKTDGLLIFLENTLATDPHVQSWQRRWEPIHRWVFQGLLLTRDIRSLIGDAGFKVTYLAVSQPISKVLGSLLLGHGEQKLSQRRRGRAT